MKKTILIMMFILLTLILVACNENVSKDPLPSDEPGIVGYVMDKEDERILVINPEAQDFSSTGGVSEYYDAIWFTNAPQDIDLGAKVKVWYDIIRDSYPGQSEVIHIEVITDQKHDGANLTEAEALYKVMTSELSNIDSLVVVKNIDYDNETNKWEINLKEIWGEEIYNIQIDDK